MTVTFDSNVWRIVSSPNRFPNEASLDSFLQIRQAITEKKLQPFLCETIFTLEAIKKKDRKDFFTDYKAKIDFDENALENGEIQLSMSIGPDKSAHPGNNAYLDAHLMDALSLGFQLIKLPRIGGIVNPDTHSTTQLAQKKLSDAERSGE